MNWKTWIPLVIAIVLGIVAAKMGRDMLTRRKVAETAPSNLTRIVAIKQDLPPGHVLDPSDLTVMDISAEAAPGNGFKSPGDAVGRVIQTPMVRGQPVLEHLLAPRGTSGGLLALVPEGMRAVTLEVNEFSGVAGLITPGAFVDVISTLHDGKSGTSVAKTIVENVKVQAVGQRLGSGPNAKEEPQQGIPKSVTLIVTPKDAEAIELATNTGRTRLMLRGAGDNGPVHTDGVTVVELIGKRMAFGARAPGIQPVSMDEPAPQPIAMNTTKPAPVAAPIQFEPIIRRKIQIIRGGVENNVEFEIGRKAGASWMTGNESDLDHVDGDKDRQE